MVRTVSEALDMIDDELPAELRRLPRWTARQLKQALSNEGWLAVDQPSGEG